MDEGKRKKLGWGKMSKVQIVSVLFPLNPLTQGKFSYMSAISKTELGQNLGVGGDKHKDKDNDKDKDKEEKIKHSPELSQCIGGASPHWWSEWHKLKGSAEQFLNSH